MSSHSQPVLMESKEKIHQYYMDIINSVPDVVYWIDVNCNLMGCNTHFINLMNLKTARELKSTPYTLMLEHAHWSSERVEALKLDDMSAIFAATSCYGVNEKVIQTDKNKAIYYKANRVPMYDEQKQVVGLIVVLTDISDFKKLQGQQKTKTRQEIKPKESVVQNQRLPTVLMIEDNVIAQNVERALLTALNCQVDVADTGDMALQLFNPGKYDLVLMDIGLTDTSGYVVAKQLRNKEKNTEHHVPIIALTGYEAEIVKYDCEQYFMEGAITKPLTSEQAEQIIKHYVYHMDVDVQGLKTI